MFTHVSSDTHNTVLCQKNIIIIHMFMISFLPFFPFIFVHFFPISSHFSVLSFFNSFHALSPTFFFLWVLLDFKKQMQCCYSLYVSHVENMIFLPLFTIVYYYKFGGSSFFVLVNLFVIFFHFFYSLIQQCCSFKVMLLIWCFLCEGDFFFLVVCALLFDHGFYFFIILLKVGVCVHFEILLWCICF